MSSTKQILKRVYWLPDSMRPSLLGGFHDPVTIEVYALQEVFVGGDTQTRFFDPELKYQVRVMDGGDKPICTSYDFIAKHCWELAQLCAFGKPKAEYIINVPPSRAERIAQAIRWVRKQLLKDGGVFFPEANNTLALLTELQQESQDKKPASA